MDFDHIQNIDGSKRNTKEIGKAELEASQENNSEAFDPNKRQEIVRINKLASPTTQFQSNKVSGDYLMAIQSLEGKKASETLENQFIEDIALLQQKQGKPQERETIFQRGTRGDEYKDDVVGAKRAQRKKQKSH